MKMKINKQHSVILMLLVIPTTLMIVNGWYPSQIQAAGQSTSP